MQTLVDENLRESELILSNTNEIYHLALRPEEIADTIILVGDPGRVRSISKHFDRMEVQRIYREFVTHTGYIGNKRLTVLSTGISTANIDIVLNELDALVNIDFANRKVKDKPRSLTLIRLGTAGCLQDEVELDDIVATDYAIATSTLMHFYPQNYTSEEASLLKAFNKHMDLGKHSIASSVSRGNGVLLEQFKDIAHIGMTITCPGFYAPQGRHLRMPAVIPDLIERLASFSHFDHKVLNFEMETAAIYGLGQVFGHRCLSLSSIVANRVTGEFTSNGKKSMERLITLTLDKLC